MTIKQSAAMLGFAFAAAWIALGLGDALLCLLGAGAFYGAAGVLLGELDLGEVQSRFAERASGSGSGAPPRRVR